MSTLFHFVSERLHRRRKLIPRRFDFSREIAGVFLGHALIQDPFRRTQTSQTALNPPLHLAFDAIRLTSLQTGLAVFAAMRKRGHHRAFGRTHTSIKTRPPSTRVLKVFRLMQTGARLASPVR